MTIKYKIHETVLTSFLSIEHRQRGLTLGEDEDFVYLIKDGHTVATFFNGPALTVKAIHQEADKWCSGGDGISELIENGCISFGKG